MKQLADLAGDLQVLAGADDQGPDRCPGCADVAVGLGGASDPVVAAAP